MDFGIALATTTESWRSVKRAEALGFSHAWFYDTQLLNPDAGLIDLSHPIPLHISAFGPKARALTAKLGAGWLMFAGAVGAAVASLRGMQECWRDAGRSDPLYSTLFTLGCVLRKSERADSKRAVAQGAPLAAAFFHDLVERGQLGEVMGSLPPFVAEAVERYRKLYERYEPADARYLTLHRGHLMFLRPEERPLYTKEIVEAFSFTATAPVLRERVEELRDAGYSQLTVQLVEGHEDALSDWAEVLKPLGLGKRAVAKGAPKNRASAAKKRRR